ncbi:aminotransferase class V-fold PLP-dependent enzyme [Novipirellula artificiosorum]|uniref:cysteine desulfurase n=1 Tax=Novipirellula artificiosorum TaxID=2528016 RepID=A0A5C6DSI5_9BACT|nr:aminotransferase class V-fold PLP-dependent enzyme [Novipirellula artificiosorum]TWU39235.1 putative cysteine desulfurase [Novipirellula artificiosorum]
MTLNRIYLDHAATSWPKPPHVLDAMDRYARLCGAAAGRGQYGSAHEADAIVHQVRRSLARFIGASSTESIALFSNGTTAINAAIFGVVRNADHVVTTAAEHNSVLRPLAHLQSSGRITLSVVGCDRDGIVSAEEVLGAVTDQTSLVAVGSAGNVTGAEQPIEEIGRHLAEHRAMFLCDAAQSFGYLPMNVETLGVDLLAAPGHKGGTGPQGTGFLYVHPERFDRVEPIVFGGTGSQSESLSMPIVMPGKLEAGNLNVPALAGWAAGLTVLLEQSELRSASHCQRLAKRLHAGLTSIDGLRVFGKPSRLPIASVAAEGMSPIDLAAILDAEFGIETRAGLHCAALVHSYLGSAPEGTLRISGSVVTTDEEIDQVVAALQAILGEA